MGQFRGLSQSEVEASRRAHGDNRFTHRRQAGFFRQFLSSFGDPIIKILLAALALNVLVSLRDHSWFEPIGIGAAVFLATFVSTLSEYGSESAFEKLQEEAERLTCRVQRREGVKLIPIGDIVTGDLVLLAPGERIPADGILIEGRLLVDQSPLNGESAEVEKHPTGTREPARWSPEERNQLLRGAVVTAGRGLLRVLRVGNATMYGSLAQELQGMDVESPMKERLGALAQSISRLGYTAAALIALADLFHAIVMDNGFRLAAILADLRTPSILIGQIFHAALLAIAIVVVAVPEGLPMMITVVLSANMQRMKRGHVMVRKLVGVETAGSLNILFTDKTGTLTTGKLRAEQIALAGGNYPSLEAVPDAALRKLVAACCRCGNEAALRGGNSTDRALQAFAGDGGGGGEGKSLGEAVLPFDSRRKFSCARLPDGRLVFKGAPEALLPRCTGQFGPGAVRRPGLGGNVQKTLSDMTGAAMRVLALAVGEPGSTAENGPLTLLGLLALRDGLRPGAARAVTQMQRAGVQTVMITGDNRETALAIAREAGIVRAPGDLVLTSTELAALSDARLRAVLPRLRVVARALPSDKSRLVRAAQELGLVAGMTGDGVNDAPALKRADVGFAMGSGAEVAKEAGDIVILDDNFASIVRAVLYGRTIFKSIRKFLVFQLTMNLCAVGVSLIAPFIGVDTPVTVTQMLWINVIMDTLGGMAFAGEPPLARYLEEPPKARSEAILSRAMFGQILVTGTYTVALCTAFLKLPLFREMFGYRTDYVGFMTAFFTLFVFCGVCNAFNARTHRVDLLSNLRRNPAFLVIMAAVSAIQILMIFFGSTVFRTEPLPPAQILRVVLLAATVIPFDLLRKLAAARLAPRERPARVLPAKE